MSKYILRSDETGPYTSTDVAERIDALDNVVVVDQSSPKMLLVDGPDDIVVELADTLPGWTASPEQMIPIPETRPMPEQNAPWPDLTYPEPDDAEENSD